MELNKIELLNVIGLELAIGVDHYARKIEQSGEEEVEEKKDEYTYKPSVIKEYDVPTFNIPFHRKKAYTNKELSIVYAFCLFAQHLRSSQYCTIMPIPTTNKRLVSLCGNSMEVSRFIKEAMKIGLIEIECSSFRFNCGGFSRSRTYRYYVENEKKLIEYCRSNNITPAEPQYNKSVVTPDNVKYLVDKLSDVKFSSNLHKHRPKNMSIREFKGLILEALKINYPLLQEYMDKVVEIGKDPFYQQHPEFAPRYVPNISLNGGKKPNRWVKKIGIRNTNELCSLPSSLKTIKHYDSDSFRRDENGNIITREELSTKMGLTLQYDVVSSVPRITRSFNEGVWYERSKNRRENDLYELIYGEYMESLKKNWDLTQLKMETYERYSMEIRDENTPKEKIQLILDSFDAEAFNRNQIKKLFMFIYFDNGSIEQLTHHVRRNMHKSREKNAVLESIKLFKQSTQTILGPTLGSEVFFHESNIYIDVTQRLMDMGYKVWQVYDGWYAHKDGVTQFDFTQTMDNLVRECFEDYMVKLRHSKGL